MKTIEAVTSELQVRVSKLSSSVDGSRSLITEVQNRLERVNLEVTEKITSLDSKVNHRIGEVEMTVAKVDNAIKGFIENSFNEVNKIIMQGNISDEPTGNSNPGDSIEEIRNKIETPPDKR